MTPPSTQMPSYSHPGPRRPTNPLRASPLLSPQLAAFVAIAALLLPTFPLPAAQTYNSLPAQSGYIFRPVIDGDWIAWAETGSYSLYAHNIKTNQTLRLSDRDPASSDIYPAVLITTASPWHPSIAIADNRVVWADRVKFGSYSGSALYSYDLTTNNRSTLATSYNLIDFPDVSDNYAAWAYGEQGFDLYNYATGRRSRPAWGNYYIPALTSRHAVFATHNGPGGDIVAMDLTTGQIKVLFDADDDQNCRPPVADGNIVAWSMRQTIPGVGDVVKVLAADITTGQVYTVCEDTHSPEHRSIVAVSGQTIVWEDWRQNTNTTYRYNLDLYGYNLLSQREFVVANNSGNQYEPDFDGNVVAFHQDYSAVNWIAITIAGDFSGDGKINADDVDPFALALTDPAAFTAAHPDLDPLLLDLTADAKIDVQDINPFLKLANLTAPPPVLLALVPEPAPAALLLPTLFLLTHHPQLRRP